MNPHRIPTILTFGVFLLGLIIVLSVIPYQVDDAFITYRFAAHLHNGNGPIFNPGGPAVEGFSSPLWLIMITIISHLTGAAWIPWIGSFLGIISYLLCIWIVVRLTVTKDPHSIWHQKSHIKTVIALPLLALLPPCIFYASTGLEALAFLAVILGFTGSLIRKFSLGTGVLSGLLALWIRPEGFWLIIVMICFWLFRPRSEIPWRKIYIPLFLSIAAGGLLLLAARLIIFGGILPNTFYAKPGIISSGLSYVIKTIGTPWGILIVLLSILGAIGGEKKHRAFFLSGISWVIAAVLEGGDWMPHGRLLLPAFGCLIMSAPGILGLLSKFKKSIINVTVCCAVPLIVLFGVIVNGITSFQILKKIDRTWSKTIQLEHTLNNWITATGADSVGSVDIGRLGFYLSIEIVDFSGLTDMTIGKSEGTHLSKSFDLDYIFVHRKPKLIVLRMQKPPLITGGNLKSFGSGSPIETRIVMDKRFASDYSFGAGLLPPASERPYYGKLIFYRKNFTIPQTLIPANRIIPIIPSKH